MSKKIALVLVMVLGLTGMAQAGYFWASASGDWATSGTWDVTTSKPVAGDDALVTWDKTIVVIGQEAATAVHVGYVANGTLNIAAGGSLTVGTSLVGQTAEGNLEVGTMNVSGIFTTQHLYVAFERANSRGVLNINNGGFMTVNEGFYVGNSATTIAGASGIINLNGNGSLICNWGYAAQLMNAQAHIDLEGGYMKFKGDNVGQIQAYINDGRLTAYDGTGTFNAPTFDGTYTTVTAIPEPATMILLGLGGLLLRKKIA